MDIEFTLAAAIAVLAAVLLAGVRRVPEGRVYTLHRFGRFVRALPPGLHFTLPVLDQIAHEVDLVGHRVRLAAPTALAQAEVYFQILEPVRTGAALDDVDAVVLRLAGDQLSQLADAAGEPKALALRLKDTLNQHLQARGLHVTRCRVA